MLIQSICINVLEICLKIKVTPAMFIAGVFWVLLFYFLAVLVVVVEVAVVVTVLA